METSFGLSSCCSSLSEARHQAEVQASQASGMPLLQIPQPSAGKHCRKGAFLSPGDRRCKEAEQFWTVTPPPFWGTPNNLRVHVRVLYES